MKIRQHYEEFEPSVDYAHYLERVISLVPRTRDKWTRPGSTSRFLEPDPPGNTKTLASGALAREASGIYYRAWQGSPARIELFLDTITGMWPAWIVHVPMFRYEIVGRVFFHELGHHVFAKRNPTAPSNEREATEIGKSFFSSYLRSRYRWWLPVIHPVRWLYWLVSKLKVKRISG